MQYKWIPQKTGGIAACVAITSFTLIITIIGIRMISKNLCQLCCNVKSGHCCSFSIFVTAVILKLLWNAIDVGLDVYTFYQLNIGKLIDPFIYRNSHVINSILAFAILGAVAVVVNIRLLHLKVKDLGKEGEIAETKLSLILITFIIEDSSELLLEYFWIQKYITVSPAYYLVVKDVIIAIVAFHTITSSVKILKSEHRDKYRLAFFGFGLLVGLLEFIRAAAVIHQYVNGTMHRSCLDVVNGKLVQHPFTTGCLRNIDYFILLLLFLPFLAIPFLVIKFRKDFSSIYENINTFVHG